MERVRLIVPPPSEYVIFELAAFKESVKHGAEITWVSPDMLENAPVPKRDFWLIDDNIVLAMRYTITGKYVGFDIMQSDVNDYVMAKQILLKHGKSLNNVTF